MAVIKIDLDQPFDEFEIGGKVYKVYYDDESMKKYQSAMSGLQRSSQKVAGMDLSAMNPEEQSAFEKEQQQEMRGFIETFFGEGTFDDIYKASGESVINLGKIASVLIEWINNKVGDLKQQKKDYYTKK
ncbi:hypothetical protein [Salibacterium aidingense]|uniref:hypothetical protein n=1 Tax=Salibacterium aidingense TaxID=384933 RepID=UPI003BD0559A